MIDDYIIFLPNELVCSLDETNKQLLIDNNKLIKIEFSISGNTTENDYGCRSLDDYNKTITTHLSDLPYYASEMITKYIKYNSSVWCPAGTYPDISVSGMLEGYDETDIRYEDKNKGFASLDGYVWVWIS